MADETASNPRHDPSTETLPVLLKRAEDMVKRRSDRAIFYIFQLPATIIFALIFLGDAYNFSNIGYTLIAFVVFCTEFTLWYRGERRERMTIKQLTSYNDLSVLGGLLDTVNCCNKKMKQQVYDAILQILPQLTEEHAGLLNTKQRTALNSLLYEKSGNLVMSTLMALEKIGDRTTLSVLSAMAAGRGIPGALRHRKPEVQERARQTVEKIRGRIEKHNRASVLLRAAHEPTMLSDNLVRPAYGSSTAGTDELLRPKN